MENLPATLNVKPGSTDLRIRQARNLPRISTLPDKEIGLVLNVIFSLLGVPLPDTFDRDVLIRYVKNHMMRYSAIEFDIAFTLYIQGKLDYNGEHYGKPSPLFIENVMQSYARYSFPIITRKNEPEPEPVPLSDAEQYNSLKKHCLEVFEEYKGTGRLLDYGSVKFRFLEVQGIINLTPERKREIMEMAKKQTAAIAKPGIKFVVYDTDDLKEESRLLALKIFFSDLIETGTELKDLFND
jgi:hypothetical protein